MNRITYEGGPLHGKIDYMEDLPEKLARYNLDIVRDPLRLLEVIVYVHDTAALTMTRIAVLIEAELVRFDAEQLRRAELARERMQYYRAQFDAEESVTVSSDSFGMTFSGVYASAEEEMAEWQRILHP